MRKIRVILLDVDGVLTDGGVILGSNGHEEKRFDIQDGMGVTLARMVGLKVGIITGRISDVVARRAKELKMDVVYQGSFHKLADYEEALNTFNVLDENVCYMGDDVLDLVLLERAGLSTAPANACDEIKKVVDVVTSCSGGHGAVRELIDLILKTQNKWDDAVRKCREKVSHP
ncbi:HAD hydrolase family protein [candidate division KSB1 bacterium]|nr:HAD hydrolase family protein [candidate division KSB1 bacterium]